jgi:hypothetical protein
MPPKRVWKKHPGGSLVEELAELAEKATRKITQTPS